MWFGATGHDACNAKGSGWPSGSKLVQWTASPTTGRTNTRASPPHSRWTSGGLWLTPSRCDDDGECDDHDHDHDDGECGDDDHDDVFVRVHVHVHVYVATDAMMDAARKGRRPTTTRR